jgi:perosamine synthetase
MSPMLPQMEPVIAEGDVAAVTEYLKGGGWLTEFERTRAFEAAIVRYTGARFCTVTPNGTLALFLALAAHKIGRGDEVIVPDFTMAATASAVILAGANVVFADIEPQTLCLDLAAVDRLVSRRTRAVIVVSLNGRAPADLEAFVEDCRRRRIAVIEDAAQSLGSLLNGRQLGTIGDCGCFSFSSQKIVTTGQGGAVVTNDAALHAQMSLLRDFGRTLGGTDRYLTVGWNLKFTDLQAVIGVEQMRRLPQLVARKRAMFGRYRDRLAGVPGIDMTATDLDSVTPWFMDVLVDAAQRDALRDHLRQHDIGSRAVYPALHAEPAFEAGGEFPTAQDVSRRGLWLPSSLRVEDADIDRVCDTIRTFMAALA